MANCKERTLNDLYNATQIIIQPEITPVLRGSCRMQGPVDERDYDIQTNTVSCRVDKGFSGHSKSQKVESGTCNVCSTPCSSCFHINRALMGSKTDEFSDETCRENAVSYSVNDFVPTVKSRKCEIGQRTASEISNLASGNSSQDSLSENAESKTSLRTYGVSGANEDVEMLLPMSSSAETVGDPQHTRGLKFDSEKKCLTKKKFEDSKGSEGHDDNISCVSRANGASNLSSYDTQHVDTINLPCYSASTSSLVRDGYGKTVHYQPASGCLEVKSEIDGSQNKSSRLCKNNEEFIQVEIPGSKERTDDTGVMKVQNAYSHLPDLKSIPCDPHFTDLEEASCLHPHGELPECSREHLNTCATKDEPDSVCRNKCTSNNCNDVQNSKVSPVGGNSEAPVKFCQMLESETNYDTSDPPAEALIFTEQNKVEKVRESNPLPEAKETSLESHHLNDSDESNILEHDVKVCDICGDGGREDLLAICCRCSDGAEHTYCMREMLDKVPEGDWLCEECKFDEELKNHRKGRFGTVVGNGKNQSSGQAGTDSNNIGVTSDSNGSDLEGNRTNKEHSSLKIFGKRHADDTEVSSAAKKQALEPIIQSPNISSPSRVAALFRENSFKNLDRMKVKPVQESFSGTYSVNGTPEAAPTTVSNAKPKVKLVDEVVPQKQKTAREPVSLDAKEGAARLIDKAMSFKSANSGRLNESKVKMLSPRFSLVQDLKGLKQAKEHNLFERKNSFKSERPLVNSPMVSPAVSSPKVDKKLISRGETMSLSSASNNRETKAMQSDSKSNTSLKPTSHAARRGFEIPVHLGEVKRQAPCLPSLVGAPSSNRISGFGQQKPIQASPKDDCSSNYCNAEQPLYNVNESLSDGLSQSREVTTLGERMKETSGSRSKQINAAVGRYIFCQKCKEIGHSEQYCTVDSPKTLAPDSSSAKSSREVMNTGNKLKAAIEAAMLKKPGIYRKNRVPDHSDELDGSNLNGEIASQGQLSSSSNTRNMISADDVHEGKAIKRNTGTDSSCIQPTVNNVMQFSVLPAEAVTSRTEDTCLIVPLDGKPSIRNLASHTSASMSSFLKISAIPEHEYMWQGAFGIYRSGPVPDLHNGIQAHLSTSASPKVPEVVKKFSHKLALNEVPRLSTWPIQFQENGVEEDNVALFFFAKDLESYEKSYKILVESMMRKDLALKGIIDGVELLIFPSNQLPEKCQCWNMMFFLWGVFRGKRASCLQHMPGSPEKFRTSQDIPMAIMSLPESSCSLGPIDKSSSACIRACNVDVASEAPPSIELPCLSSTERINGDCDTKVSSLVPQDKGVQINVERQESGRDYDSLSTIPRSNAHLCTEIRSAITSQDGHVDSNCKKDGEVRASAQVIRTVGGSNRSAKMTMHWDTPLDRHHVSSHYVDKIPSSMQEVASAVVSEENLEEGLPNANAYFERETQMGDQTMKELNPWHFNNRQRRHVDPNESVLQAAAGGTSQVIPWDGVNKMLADGFGSPMHEVDSSSTTKEKRSEGCCDGTVVIPNNPEKYLFPVDPLPVKKDDIGLGDNSSTPWNLFFSRSVIEEDGLHDRTPNLELALGETKSSSTRPPFLVVGKVDKKINQNELPDKVAVAFREEEQDDDESADLSLSLSFPFPDKELAVKPVTKAEQLLPDRRHVKTSLLLFGGSSNKY